MIFLGLAVALAGGLAWGLINGFLVAKAKIPAFIVTLGTLGMSLGAALVISGGVDEREVPFKLITTIGTGRAFDNQVPGWCSSPSRWRSSSASILAATRFGRYTYAVGSNEEAARRAGVPVDRHLMKVYALAGTLAGLAGFLSLARFSTTTIGGHDTDNLQAIAAVVIGGTSLFGGIGTMLGTRLRRLHPGRPAERLRDRGGQPVLAEHRRRRGAHRRRVPRPIAPPVPIPAVTVPTL